jgi:alcohol dehydrogenase (cytochrome c)
MNLRTNVLFLCVATSVFAQAPEGRQSFLNHCAVCHGTDGNGGEHAPSILARAQIDSEQNLRDLLRQGIPLRGMPPFPDLPEAEATAMVGYLKTLSVAPAGRRGGRGGRGFGPVSMKVQTTDGKSMEGMVIGRTGREVQLRRTDQGIHLLRKVGELYREVTSQTDWVSYHGGFSGNRHSTLSEINTVNVAHLIPKWVFPVSNAGRLQGTPQVYKGIMYVTSTNMVIALDAGTGAHLWQFSRPATSGLVGNARSPGNNRSVAVSGNSVFMQTDNAHLLALNRLTGSVLWETEMADWRRNYNTTGSMIAIEDLVVAGTAGGEQGVRGFVAAYDQATGKEVWRFWTIPAPGEKGSETWDGPDIEHGGGPTWLTGSYDPETKTVYWATGNAGPDFNGDNRKGDNLYTCSILALDLRTGKLKWHYQATPHDEWDWDAVQPLVLVDANWHGIPHKLLLQANRNGFLYVLDRVEGKLLLAKPLVPNITWAKGIDANGRPVMNDHQTPTAEGTRICPAVDGATNFFSTSYSPLTRLFYVNTLDSCAVFTKRPSGDWAPGRGYSGGGSRRIADEKGRKVLRAYDIQTGKVKWELPQDGQGDSWSGTMSTSGGLVFFGDDAGALAAADAVTGKRLWSYPFTESLHASPMSFQFDNHQYVSIEVGSQVYTFGLAE